MWKTLLAYKIYAIRASTSNNIIEYSSSETNYYIMDYSSSKTIYYIIEYLNSQLRLCFIKLFHC